MDDNDKLKPFDFCKHGDMDMFSIKILWLRLSYTKKHQPVVCQYYLDAIRTLRGLLKKVRADRVIEMVYIC